jgi:hypothetical protein
MPYHLTWEGRGVYRQYVGDVTIADRRASFEAICVDPRFDALRYAITDYRAVVAYEATRDATAEIAALHIGPLLTNPRIVMAAVADRADVISAIEDFIAHGFTTAPYRVFRTVDEARLWISGVSGLPADGIK